MYKAAKQTVVIESHGGGVVIGSHGGGVVNSLSPYTHIQYTCRCLHVMTSSYQIEMRISKPFVPLQLAEAYVRFLWNKKLKRQGCHKSNCCNYYSHNLKNKMWHN